MSRFAELTNNSSEKYKNKAEQLKNFINEKYFDKDNFTYSNGSQAALSVALALDIVPVEYQEKVASKLNDIIIDNNYFLDFGLLGSKYVLRMLSKYGYSETAYKMASKDEAPSWGNWIKLGFSSLPETWKLSPDFRDASANHRSEERRVGKEC